MPYDTDLGICPLISGEAFPVLVGADIYCRQKVKKRGRKHFEEPDPSSQSVQPSDLA